MAIDVVVRQHKPVWPTLVGVGFGLWILGLLWWTLTAAVLAAVIWWGYQQALKTQAEHQRLRRDADRQHQQVLQGDPAGWWGNHPPAI